MLKFFSTSNLLFLFVCILFSCKPNAQKKENNEPFSFREAHINGVNAIYIDCDMTSYNSIYKNFKENSYIPASIEYKGQNWSNVKLRIRGDSSRKLSKKSLKLKFSKDSLFQGVRKVNLNAEWYDKSYMSQYISSYLMRENDVICFNSTHTAVFLNNEFYGIYLMVENVDKTFLESRGISKLSEVYKATKDGACFNDSSEVETLWEKKTSNVDLSKNKLKKLITEVNNLTVEESYDYYKQHFEYDNLISVVALNILLGNKSTYYHNYYLMENAATNKWSMLPWDMDKTLMKNLVSLHYTRTTWSEGLNSNLPDNTIPEFIFLNNKMKDDLILKINEIVNSTFNPTYLNPIIDSLSFLLNPLIQLDTIDNVSEVSEWNVALLELRDFIEERPKIVFNQIKNYPSSFEVYPNENKRISWSSATSNTSVVYTLKLCIDFNFKKSSIYSYSTKNNSIVLKDLPKGTYYYFVDAKNEMGSTTAFRIKSTIIIK